ncbi:MAG: hypothetical protein ACLUL2_11950 [Blautia sp.]
MREEASAKQWEKLYEVTCNLKALEPWKYFWDTQLVAIFLKDSEAVFINRPQDAAEACRDPVSTKGWRGSGILI